MQTIKYNFYQKEAKPTKPNFIVKRGCKAQKPQKTKRSQIFYLKNDASRFYKKSYKYFRTHRIRKSKPIFSPKANFAQKHNFHYPIMPPALYLLPPVPAVLLRGFNA
jgi:hypothetical protein